MLCRTTTRLGRYHYGIASAMGYALSMFSETLRDRKIVTLEQARDRHACAPRRRASAPRAHRRPRHLSDSRTAPRAQDLLILIFGFCFPMVSIVIDGLTYGPDVTIWPPDYWVLFGGPHIG